MTFTAPAFVTVPTASLGTPMARSANPSPLKSILTEGRLPRMVEPRAWPEAPTERTGTSAMAPATSTTAHRRILSTPLCNSPAGAGSRHIVDLGLRLADPTTGGEAGGPRRRGQVEAGIRHRRSPSGVRTDPGSTPIPSRAAALAA